MRPENIERVTVTIGEGIAVLKRTGQGSPTIANILGIDRDAEGNIETVYLDRMVHKPMETSFEGWTVSGAIATEMRPTKGKERQ
jgi:hypothetical protein